MPAGAGAVAVARESARSVPAAFLAALAESGPIFLPLRFVAEQSAVAAHGGPLASYPLFALLFAGGVALATLGRRSRALGPAVAVTAVAAGVAQSRWWGGGDVGAAAIAVLLALAVAVRVATLALRDWRDPVHVSFGVLTGILFFEVVVARPAGWSATLVAVVPIFFAGSLASRAASLRIGDAEGLDPAAAGARRPWGRVIGTTALAGLALVVAAALVGGQGHVLERVGRFIPLAVYGAIYAGTVVASWVLRPVGWLLSKLGFHAAAIQRLLRRLPRFRHRAGRFIDQHGPAGGSLRIIGLIVLIGTAALLVWLILRQRRRWLLSERSLTEVPPEIPRPIAPVRPTGRKRRRPRGELPEDSVRRLYAETLLALEEWGAPRPRWTTPGEYLGVVRDAIPDSAPSFTALTRAYEDVRYGSRTFDAAALDILEVHRDAVLDAVRRAPRPERGDAAAPAHG